MPDCPSCVRHAPKVVRASKIPYPSVVKEEASQLAVWMNEWMKIYIWRIKNFHTRYDQAKVLHTPGWTAQVAGTNKASRACFSKYEWRRTIDIWEWHSLHPQSGASSFFLTFIAGPHLQQIISCLDIFCDKICHGNWLSAGGIVVTGPQSWSLLPYHPDKTFVVDWVLIFLILFLIMI